MLALKSLDSSIISLIILLIVYINVHNRSKKIFTSNNLFVALVRINMIMLVIDLCKWLLNGVPGSFSMISNKTFNFLHYSLAPAAPILWLLYTNYQVYHDQKRLRKLKYILFFPFILNSLASVLSLYTGWIYIVDDNNFYHRGKYLWIFVTFCFLLLGISFFYVFKNRKNIEKRYYYALISFFLPAVIGITMQLFIFGSNYAWTGMMLSLLIVYFYIQDRSLNTDYLTGVFNRRQLDRYIKVKIQNSTENKTFSAILIDLNKFKQINDNFGHAIGDEALRESVNIIRKCL
ncbi:MAG: diguanylate cyclase [Epulopiscium sp.]|nr:diguanylate cyclase [Candidatus Epulonipiscium sp.]